MEICICWRFNLREQNQMDLSMLIYIASQTKNHSLETTSVLSGQISSRVMGHESVALSLKAFVHNFVPGCDGSDGITLVMLG